jgi:hypothetical protein
VHTGWRLQLPECVSLGQVDGDAIYGEMITNRNAQERKCQWKAARTK